MADDDKRRPWYMPGGETSSSSNLNTRIMIIAIISLSSVILLVLALHIYARCVLARRVNRRRAAAIHRLALSQSQSQPGHTQINIVVPKPGLDSAVVAALPIFKFKALKFARGFDKSNDPIECSVCLSLLEDEDMVRQLPNCNHSFHVECIDKWLEFNINCPLCRAEAEPRVLQPSAPPVETEAQPHSTDAAAKSAPPASVIESTSRLSSFRRMLSRERSSTRIQPSAPEADVSDVERQ